VAKFRTIRAIRKIGGGVYLSLPVLARRELRLLVGDFVTLELDDQKKTLSIAPVNLREQMPFIGFHGTGMTPVDEPNVEPTRATGDTSMTPVLEEIA
jgi:hypothetical protein